MINEYDLPTVFPTFYFQNITNHVNIVTGLYRCTFDNVQKNPTLEQFKVIL